LRITTCPLAAVCVAAAEYSADAPERDPRADPADGGDPLDRLLDSAADALFGSSNPDLN
jgi:hypothetical protein